MSAAIRRMAILHTLCCYRQITIQQLASKYQACPRTIRYDIEALSPHYPIETVRGRYGGCVRLAEGYVPSTCLLSPAQMEFLLNWAQILNGKDEMMLMSIIRVLVPPAMA